MSSIQESIAIRLLKVFKESWHWDKDARSTASREHRVNYLISQPTLYKFTSCFSSGKKWREKRENQNCLLPILPQHRQKSHPPAAAGGRSPSNINKARFAARYFSRIVSIKQKWKSWASWHSLMKPCSSAPQQAYCHHFGVLSLKSTRFCMLQVWGCQHAHPTPWEVLQIFTLPPAYLMAHLCLSIQTHSWLYVKQHTLHSNRII